MPSSALIIILAVAVVALIYVIRYVISSAVDKGADAIRNSIVQKKNAEKTNESENLADRFGKDR